MPIQKIVLIVHNVRSCHNVGSILRSADAFGIDAVYLTGYTPFPTSDEDKRLPHLAAKLNKQIAKTALGAEMSVNWAYRENIAEVLSELVDKGYIIAALEQTRSSVPLTDYSAASDIALIVGREVEGIEKEVLDKVSLVLEIPMMGKKESLNVSVAAAIAMHHLRLQGGQPRKT
ncbi:MAG: hypothetical protein JWO96_496 [Candidatus Saccharibacteria bacterium]|nr:hypothetical protein [Candidatus Saccharibacteria bacterium]